jgi:hypothetical protein
MQAELVEMTWLDDDRLLTIADSTMPDEDQQRMAELSNHEGLAPAQHDELKALRDSYGKMTLRKARALALLSVRSGKRLLAPHPTLPSLPVPRLLTRLTACAIESIPRSTVSSRPCSGPRATAAC